MSKQRPSPLYRPEDEHDACGAGFFARITGERSHECLELALNALKALAHRRAIDADAITGDGAGMLLQLPHEIFLEYFESQKRTAPTLDTRIPSYRFESFGAGSSPADPLLLQPGRG